MPFANIERRRERQRQWLAARRAAFFADKRCVQCGSTERLELHHTDPRQKETHRIWSFSQARRDAEIAKCIVLCHDCHTEVTRQQKRKPAIHGTAQMYWRGCRCASCRQANAALKREYDRQKKLLQIGL